MGEGTIATFYSYKGGVGRTLVLANIAALLTGWGYKTLCIDWDLEAPGLHLYFEKWTADKERRGLVDLIQDYTDEKYADWHDYLTEVRFQSGGNAMSLINAGKQDQSYADRLQTIDWEKLYENKNFGHFLEELREEWKRSFDFVLIDSRTGITDIGGICTIQLPDILVLLFTANNQSLKGAIEIANRAKRSRNNLPFDRGKLLVLPIPTRFELHVEYEIASHWLDMFAKYLSPFYDEWAHKEVLPAELLNFTRVPYIPYWSFGERLPVVEKGTDSPDDIGFSLETLAALLADKLSNTKKLIENRDSFVAEGRRSRIIHLPLERNHFFTGRDDILQKLNAALKADGKTGSLQVISGMGGIGKTQLVLEYAYKYRNNYKYIFWVKADSDSSLNSDFAEIAKLLELPEKDSQRSEETVEAVKRWMERNNDWLLIMDGADNPETVKPFLPKKINGHILLTSRSQLFDTLGIARTFELKVLNPEESFTFLVSRTGKAIDKTDDREAAKELGTQLGYLPLALEQAGAYIASKKVSFPNYLEIFRKHKIAALERVIPKTGDYGRTVSKSLSLSFGKLEENSPASEVLRLSAFLHPDAIPFELLELGADELSPSFKSFIKEALVINELLEPLIMHSLVQLDTDSKTYNIHSLMQEAVKDVMNAEERREWAERTVRVLNRAFPSAEFENWPLCERLLPHAKVAAKLIEEWDFEFQEAAALLNKAAFYLTKHAQYTEAELLFKRALAIRENSLGSEHPDTAESLNYLARLYYLQGKHSEAEPLHKRALAICQKTLGAEHPDTARSLNSLADFYYSQGKYEEAEPLFKRALGIREKTLDSEHPDTAASLNNLAKLYYSQGKYEEAEPLLKRALGIREKTLGSEHPDTAASLNNLAKLYYSQGKYEEAEPLYKRALGIFEKTLGSEHPDTAASLNNLALLYYSQGKYEEAETLYKRALGIREKTLGSEHPDTARSLNNLAFLYYSQGKNEEAEPLYKRALAIFKKKLGDNHPDTVTAKKNYNALLSKMGRPPL